MGPTLALGDINDLTMGGVFMGVKWPQKRP